MTDPTLSEKKTGFGKVGSSILAAAISGYVVNQFSLHGWDFAALGVPSEVVKASIEGTLVGFFVWATPQNFVEFLVCSITFCKKSWKEIMGAVDQ